MRLYKYAQSHDIIIRQRISVTLVNIIRVSYNKNNNMWLNIFINVHLLFYQIRLKYSLTFNVYWLRDAPAGF